jgi:formamidopyrimidine-DNA glycosylase
MPELPEVESIRQSLLPAVTGRVIGRWEVLTPGVFMHEDLPLTGWTVSRLERRGKYLIFRLRQPGWPAACLVVHLRMSGRLLLSDGCGQPKKHTHVRFRLDPVAAGGPDAPLWLDYHDPRRFGRLWLYREGSPGGTNRPAGLEALGPEPLDPSFGQAEFAARLRRRSRTSLKAVLLDQTVLAGLGNIYADESLFASGLSPCRTVESLSGQEIAGLLAAIRSVLGRAIACQGTTLKDYVNGWNQKGTFQDCLMVYSRRGQPCRLCGRVIESARLAGRTTCWCPGCQPQEPKEGAASQP